MNDDEAFNDALSCVSQCWHRELGFMRSWADSVAIEWDDREEPTGYIVFSKGVGTEHAFLIGDDCWDGNEPRADMITALLDDLVAVREALSYACDCLDTEGLDETADRLRRQGGARKL